MSILNSKTKTPKTIHPQGASYPCIFTTSSAVYGSYEFEIHKVLFESMSILNSKTKTPKTIHPPGESYPCIFTTSSVMYGSHKFEIHKLRIWYFPGALKVCLFWIQKQKHQKKFIHKEHLILAYSPPHLRCTGVTNLKFTRFCLKVCLFWIQKQKHQKQFIRQENRSHIHHICGVRDSQIWNSQGPVWKYVYFEFKNKNTSARRILSLHIHHLIETHKFEIHKVLFESMSILNSKTKTPKKIYPPGESYPCIFTTSSAMYGSYEFEIFLVLFESMSILNSKTKTPKTIHPPGES